MLKWITMKTRSAHTTSIYSLTFAEQCHIMPALQTNNQTKDTSMSVDEARYIIRTLQEQIPHEEARLADKKACEISSLRARLKELEG